MSDVIASEQLDLAKVVHDLVPALQEDLKTLVAIPSINAPGHEGDLENARTKIIEFFQGAGIHTQAITVSHGGKTTTPLVYARHDGPVGARTVLLYAHYDVQPADDNEWKITAPFQPKQIGEPPNTRLYGRGTADDKSGVCMHLGVVRALAGKIPVNLKIVIEGEEEIGRGVLEDYILHNDDERFHADLIVVADTGNVRLGVPTITTSLRGLAGATVSVDTLRQPVHSGMYGGPAPDAFMALTRILATLHDDNGDVAVKGLVQDSLGWPAVDESQFRRDAGLLDGVPLIGTRSIAERLYGKPSINVVGLDGPPSYAQATNVLVAHAKAKISMRIAPHQDPAKAVELLTAHIKAHAPWGVAVTVDPIDPGYGFAANTGGPYFVAAEQALKATYSTDSVVHGGQGGSIPLVHAFAHANPEADIVLWGCEEPLCSIHGPDESVAYRELEAMTTAEAVLLSRVGGLK
ncbi:dipeptidase [Saccharothrix violaceirubra]|uniref:Acetylornithine deacetylase/succinyl-diaminopimelate desuccinylase-like protein n=1 Tax=Saccharothrix violaceirubra TaxID=413306 RepID=A0A7W7T1S1_9PSEU|nr:M20/M25/M40 family metallo-hydrolase [Saccharothrix violaceirubra]MBB4964941.1 acetylornithine deacetylase/succinyl-diaminopimelate desuccinylase-like protein [Saccharothrix violaceirubra]